MNKVMLIGRLGKDPEIRYAANGTAIANMRIATDESYVDRDGNRVPRTEWHSVVVFQRQAENCKTYLGKGSLVFVEGSLQTRKWQDQQGQDRYSTDIKAQRVQFLDRRGGAEAGHEEGNWAGGPRQQGGRQSSGGDSAGPVFPSEASRNDFPTEASDMDDVPF